MLNKVVQKVSCYNNLFHIVSFLLDYRNLILIQGISYKTKCLVKHIKNIVGPINWKNNGTLSSM